MRRVSVIAIIVLEAAAAAVAVARAARREARAATPPPPEPWNHVVLVELFTSQGCSSCPPADQLVAQLPALGLARDRVVPLAFHVDYWDGLGWSDPFATPAFTERQRWYAQSGRLRSPHGGRDGDDRGDDGIKGLYTPQMIVDGQVHFPGGRGDVVATEIRKAATRAATVDLAARAVPVAGTIRAGQTSDVAHSSGSGSGVDVLVTVDVSPRAPLDPVRDWRLVAALAAKTTMTRVLHGENGGETLREAAVVRALSDRVPLRSTATPAAPAPGATPARTPAMRQQMTLTLRKPKDLAWSDVVVVAFVQSERTHEIGGAIEVAVNPR